MASATHHPHFFRRALILSGFLHIFVVSMVLSDISIPKVREQVHTVFIISNADRLFSSQGPVSQLRMNQSAARQDHIISAQNETQTQEVLPDAKEKQSRDHSEFTVLQASEAPSATIPVHSPKHHISSATDNNKLLSNLSAVPSEKTGTPIEFAFGAGEGPSFLHNEMPVYPLAARRLGKEGSVLLRLSINENGKLVSVDVVKGAGHGLTEAAIEAVKKSRFLPARRDGKSIASRALLPIKFTLR